MPEKEKKDIHCKGRLPGTSKECGELLYQTDGELIFINNIILNKDLRTQTLVCGICGQKNFWKKNEKYFNDETDRMTSNINRSNRLEPKFNARFKRRS